jgi:hypothetical protein
LLPALHLLILIELITICCILGELLVLSIIHCCLRLELWPESLLCHVCRFELNIKVLKSFLLFALLVSIAYLRLPELVLIILIIGDLRPIVSLTRILSLRGIRNLKTIIISKLLVRHHITILGQHVMRQVLVLLGVKHMLRLCASKRVLLKHLLHHLHVCRIQGAPS